MSAPIKEEKKELIFDLKKFILGKDHSHYKLDYDVFYAEVDTTDMDQKEAEKVYGEVVRKTSQACFSQFTYALREFKKNKPNRIRFFCDPKKHSDKSVHLSKMEIKEWVKVCKKNKLMPKSIGKNFIKNNIFDINFEDLSLERLYVYLCAARYVQEDPFFVKGILYLMEEHKMGFFTSFCVATHFQITNSGHHILPQSRAYSIAYKPNVVNAPEPGGVGSSFDMLSTAQLVNFLNSEDKGKPIKELSSSAASFNIHGALNKHWLKERTKRIIIPREKLISKHLEKALKTGEFNKSL